MARKTWETKLLHIYGAFYCTPCQVWCVTHHWWCMYAIHLLPIHSKILTPSFSLRASQPHHVASLITPLVSPSLTPWTPTSTPSPPLLNALKRLQRTIHRYPSSSHRHLDFSLYPCVDDHTLSSVYMLGALWNPLTFLAQEVSSPTWGCQAWLWNA